MVHFIKQTIFLLAMASPVLGAFGDTSYSVQALTNDVDVLQFWAVNADDPTVRFPCERTRSSMLSTPLRCVDDNGSVIWLHYNTEDDSGSTSNDVSSGSSSQGTSIIDLDGASGSSDLHAARASDSHSDAADADVFHDNEPKIYVVPETKEGLTTKCIVIASFLWFFALVGIVCFIRRCHRRRATVGNLPTDGDATKSDTATVSMDTTGGNNGADEAV